MLELIIPLLLLALFVAAALVFGRRARLPDEITRRQLDEIVAENSRSASGTLGATRATLAVASEIGVDPRAETDVTFYLDVPDLLDAERIAEIVASKGVSARVSDAAAPPPAVIVTTRMIPTELAIEQWIARLETIASAYGGKVDGWEVPAGDF